MSWKRMQKHDPHKLFQEILESQMGRFWPQNVKFMGFFLSLVQRPPPPLRPLWTSRSPRAGRSDLRNQRFEPDVGEWCAEIPWAPETKKKQGSEEMSLIECFRGRHRGGRNSTSFLRFSRHFSWKCSKMSFSTLKLAPLWREPSEAPLDSQRESADDPDTKTQKMRKKCAADWIDCDWLPGPSNPGSLLFSMWCVFPCFPKDVEG